MSEDDVAGPVPALPPRQAPEATPAPTLEPAAPPKTYSSAQEKVLTGIKEKIKAADENARTWANWGKPSPEGIEAEAHKARSYVVDAVMTAVNSRDDGAEIGQAIYERFGKELLSNKAAHQETVMRKLDVQRANEMVSKAVSDLGNGARTTATGAEPDADSRLSSLVLLDKADELKKQTKGLDDKIDTAFDKILRRDEARFKESVRQYSEKMISNVLPGGVFDFNTNSAAYQWMKRNARVELGAIEAVSASRGRAVTHEAKVTLTTESQMNLREIYTELLTAKTEGNLQEKHAMDYAGKTLTAPDFDKVRRTIDSLQKAPSLGYNPTTLISRIVDADVKGSAAARNGIKADITVEFTQAHIAKPMNAEEAWAFIKKLTDSPDAHWYSHGKTVAETNAEARRTAPAKPVEISGPDDYERLPKGARFTFKGKTGVKP